MVQQYVLLLHGATLTEYNGIRFQLYLQAGVLVVTVRDPRVRSGGRTVLRM